MPNKFISSSGTGFLTFQENFSFYFDTDEEFYKNPYIVRVLRANPGSTLYKSEIGDGYEIVGHYPNGITRVLGYIKNDIASVEDINTIVEPIEPDPFNSCCRCNIL